MLFFAEPVFAMADPALNQRQLETELKKTRRALENKKTELQAVLAQADEVAHTDALTFLPNRKLIIADLQRQVTYSDRYGTPLTISMIDLDHFKVVNDTYGHSVGDDVLKLIALQLRAHIREPDLIGRYGGEEFLVVLPHTSISDACEQATRLCQHVRSRPIVAHQHAIHMTISIGLAQYKIHEEKWQTLLNRADQALYQAKHNGRDQWAVIQA